jgi:hypothetical protein
MHLPFEDAVHKAKVDVFLVLCFSFTRRHLHQKAPSFVWLDFSFNSFFLSVDPQLHMYHRCLRSSA